MMHKVVLILVAFWYLPITNKVFNEVVHDGITTTCFLFLCVLYRYMGQLSQFLRNTNTNVIK